MTHVHLSLGSNLEPEQHLRAALRELRARFGPLQVSSVYETAAVGFDGPPFWNFALGLHTDLDAEALKDWLHALEAREGRVRGEARYTDRTLDIDIVAIDGTALERPELREAFVLAPLDEIAPGVRIPQEDATVGELWARRKHAGGDMPRRIPLTLDGSA
jgi:2-amino-4-hydroxy-6-hydroxymethyldihydropteridine diphosphokinase